MSRQPDVSHILRIGMGFQASKTLLAAVGFGLFSILGNDSRTGEEIRRELNLHPRGIWDFLDSLVALGFLERDGDGVAGRYSNTVDTAAFLDLRFSAVGRPSCNAGGKLVVRLAQATLPENIVVVADADDPGRRGAARLAAELRVVCPSVRILEPGRGAKDARAWVNAGADADEIRASIAAAAPIRIDVCSRRKARA